MPNSIAFRAYCWSGASLLPRTLAWRLAMLAVIATGLPFCALLALLAVDGADMPLDPTGTALTLGAATLIAALFAFSAMAIALSPFSHALRALETYIASRTMPDLPTHFDDEIGRLMAAIQRSAETTENLIGLQQRLAMTDPLTGLANRRAFEERSEEELARIARHGHAATIAVIDLDHFKQVNDRYGHAVGDAVLKHFAGLLRVKSRRQDVLARTGGEEFVFLFPDTTIEQGEAALAKLRQIAAAMPIDGHPGLSVTFSAGISPLFPGETLADALERADRALYAAKRAGRDRVAVSPASAVIMAAATSRAA